MASAGDQGRNKRTQPGEEVRVKRKKVARKELVAAQDGQGDSEATLTEQNNDAQARVRGERRGRCVLNKSKSTVASCESTLETLCSLMGGWGGSHGGSDLVGACGDKDISGMVWLDIRRLVAWAL